LNPSDERSRLALADVLVAKGDLERARAALRETVGLIPRSGEAHWKLARVCQSLGDENGALSAFEAAAALSPLVGASHVHAAIGRLYHNRLDLEAATRAYRRRLDFAPADPTAHLELGDVYRAQDQLNAALAEYLIAAWLDPNGGNAFASIGQVHAASGRDSEAVQALRRAVDLAPTNLEARYALSRALARLGRTEDARRELELFEQLQAKAMEEQRRQFRENQRKIDDALTAGDVAEPAR
jgi:tetratricopeptide (TPR) repeat protein